MSGDTKSINEVHRGIDAIGRDEQLSTLVRHQREEIGKLYSRLRAQIAPDRGSQVRPEGGGEGGAA